MEETGRVRSGIGRRTSTCELLVEFDDKWLSAEESRVVSSGRRARVSACRRVLRAERVKETRVDVRENRESSQLVVDERVGRLGVEVLQRVYSQVPVKRSLCIIVVSNKYRTSTTVLYEYTRMCSVA